MTDISYVCLSDLHLGEEDSILTALSNGGVDTKNPSPVMVELVRCLKELISKNKDDVKPTLILNGDILELALSTTEISAMVFERFIELFVDDEGKKLFEKIIYIPGNHDHHLWERERETQYLGYIKRHPKPELPAPWHKTEMFLEELKHPPRCTFLEDLLNRHSSEVNETFAKDLKILVAYPNFGLRSKNDDRCIVIHHGHFVESEYRLMSTLKVEIAEILEIDYEIHKDIQKLEAENFAWIEFLWSTLGRSGDVGGKVETLYEYKCNIDHIKKHIPRIAERIVKEFDLKPKLAKNLLEEQIMPLVLERLIDWFSKRERGIRNEEMSEKTVNGVAHYLNFTQNQINEECKEWTPSELVFVFGHTHKPCEKQVSIDWINGNVPVYNTGGWVVDTENPHKVFGGSVVLIDDELNLASLRMYNEEEEDLGTCRVKVKAVDEIGKENPLYDKICDLIDCEEEPWDTFSSKTSDAVNERQKKLGERLKKS